MCDFEISNRLYLTLRAIERYNYCTINIYGNKYMNIKKSVGMVHEIFNNLTSISFEIFIFFYFIFYFVFFYYCFIVTHTWVIPTKSCKLRKSDQPNNDVLQCLPEQSCAIMCIVYVRLKRTVCVVFQ